jgi:hypothetical protein
MPIHYLIIEALQTFLCGCRDDFHGGCPAGSGTFRSIKEIADELGRRLLAPFTTRSDIRRPVITSHPKLATEPHFTGQVPLHEYYHDDTGRGLSATLQSDWTALITRLIRPYIPEIPNHPRI